MIKTNYYTGEMSNNYITEAEAVQNAGFGQYTVQQNTPPMTYGLGGNVYQQQYGYGMPPQQQYYQNPYMNYPGAGQGVIRGNPALQMGYVPQQSLNINPGYMGNQQAQYTQVYIPPINPFGCEYIYPTNIEDICQRLMTQYIQEKAESEGRMIAERARLKREGKFNPYYNGYYNYYNAPMYGSNMAPFQTNIFEQFQEIQDKAKQNARNLQMNLSRLCHAYLKDGVTEEQIQEMYTGHVINVQNTIYEYSEYDALEEKFKRLVPYDGTTAFRKQFDDTRAKIQSILTPDTTVENFGERMSELYATWEMEELKDKNREFDSWYDSNSYKKLLKQRCAEKAAREAGFSLLDPTGNKYEFLQLENQISAIETKLNKVKQTKQSIKDESIPVEDRAKLLKNNLDEMGFNLLSDCITIDEDGNLCMSAGVGLEKAKARGEVRGENETAYQEKRLQFAGFLDSIPKSYELDEQKHKQYDGFTEFEYNMTHPPSSIENNEGGG